MWVERATQSATSATSREEVIKVYVPVGHEHHLPSETVEADHLAVASRQKGAQGSHRFLRLKKLEKTTT